MMLVLIKSDGPSIERSTWLSAARCITEEGWCFSKTIAKDLPSQMSTFSCKYRCESGISDTESRLPA